MSIRAVVTGVGLALVVGGAAFTSTASAVPAPSPTTAFVADEGCGAQGTTVTPFDVVSKAPESPMTLGAPGTVAPLWDAITPDGQTLYVGAFNGDVYKIDTATRTIVATIPIPGLSGFFAAPWTLAVAPDGQTVYVIAQSTGDATVVPISVATNTVGTPIDVGAAANGMAITPDGSTLYVSDAVDQVVTPVTLPAGVVGKPIQVHPSVGSIAITPNGRRAYAADGADSVVIPINLTSKTAGKPIGVGTGGPFGIAITPDGKTVYVADEDTGTVTPIAVRTNTAGAPIKVGGGPSGVVVGPAGKTVYVTNQNTGGVTPINVRSGVPGSLIGSDRCPIGIAITPDQPPVAAFSERVRPHGHASRFNASASYPQSTPIATYAWNWGDGQRTRTTSPVTTHTYQEKGHHRVTLTVTDTAGTSTTQVFTGQTMSRNGSRIAQAVKTITIA